jgi:hypothetical protein
VYVNKNADFTLRPGDLRAPDMISPWYKPNWRGDWLFAYWTCSIPAKVGSCKRRSNSADGYFQLKIEDLCEKVKPKWSGPFFQKLTQEKRIETTDQSNARLSDITSLFVGTVRRDNENEVVLGCPSIFVKSFILKDGKREQTGGFLSKRGPLDAQYVNLDKSNMSFGIWWY